VGTYFLFVVKNILETDSVNGCITLTILKVTAVHFKRVNFMVCELHLKN
jgi:hypothetical protein